MIEQNTHFVQSCGTRCVAVGSFFVVYVFASFMLTAFDFLTFRPLRRSALRVIEQNVYFVQ